MEVLTSNLNGSLEQRRKYQILLVRERWSDRARSSALLLYYLKITNRNGETITDNGFI